jgi:hypothetical protein
MSALPPLLALSGNGVPGIQYDFQYSVFATGIRVKIISGLYTGDNHSIGELNNPHSNVIPKRVVQKELNIVCDLDNSGDTRGR